MNKDIWIINLFHDIEDSSWRESYMIHYKREFYGRKPMMSVNSVKQCRKFWQRGGTLKGGVYELIIDVILQKIATRN